MNSDVRTALAMLAIAAALAIASIGLDRRLSEIALALGGVTAIVALFMLAAELVKGNRRS